LGFQYTLVVFIEEADMDDGTAPVFKLADLAQLGLQT